MECKPHSNTSECTGAVDVLVIAPEDSARTSSLTECLSGELNREGQSRGFPFSSPGVKLIVDAPQLFPRHMGVDLRGGDLAVAQHQLNGSQVRPPFQEVGCE